MEMYSYASFVSKSSKFVSTSRFSLRHCLLLQATFEKLENEMKEVNANAEALMRNFLELTELKHILRKTQSFFEEVRLAVILKFHDSVHT